MTKCNDAIFMPCAGLECSPRHPLQVNVQELAECSLANIHTKEIILMPLCIHILRGVQNQTIGCKRVLGSVLERETKDTQKVLVLLLVAHRSLETDEKKRLTPIVSLGLRQQACLRQEASCAFKRNTLALDPSLLTQPLLQHFGFSTVCLGRITVELSPWLGIKHKV